MAKPTIEPGINKQVIDRLIETKKTIVTAESCTGGLIAAALTDVPGSSAAVYGGYVTYANTAKSRMIHVQARLIRDYGAVSNQVARAMADGARNTAHADFAVAVTESPAPTVAASASLWASSMSRCRRNWRRSL